MTNPAYYFWILLLIIYIISPLDLVPAFFDDLIALVVLIYMTLKQRGVLGGTRYTHSKTRYKEGNQSYHRARPDGDLSLQEAYRTLGVAPNAAWEDIKKAYKEKIRKNHPDKVSHLSEEIQEKAREMTIRLNNLFELIEKSRKN